MSQKRQYTSCGVGDLLVGFPIECVQEVTGAAELTPVPLASPFISGLLNLRGEIVTAIDLRKCLHAGDRPAAQTPLQLILRDGDDSVSLLIDDVGDVVDVDEADAVPAPVHLSEHLRGLITQVYPFGRRLLLVLDASAVLASAYGESRNGSGGM